MTQNNWIQQARDVFALEIEGLEGVKNRLGDDFARAVAMLAACRGRVVVTGLGKSGLVGRKIAATFSSTGTPSFFLHPVEGAHGDLGSIREGDVVLAISYSGKTAEVIAVMPALRSLGAKLIALVGDAASPMARLADITLDVAIPREACPMDLAPTSSTTATLVMGDALAVCLMQAKAFTSDDFKKFHPGGSLGQRLRLKISEVMHTQNLPVVLETATMTAAVTVMDQGGLGAALVTDAEGRLTGIVTDGDIRRFVCRGTFDPASPVASLMTKNPRHGNAENSVAELLDLMERAAITVLPVTREDNTLLGVIHLHDLLGKGTVHFTV
ncbi:KpsF/GutQ family sugar-phosphate isomerase [Desulfovibrio sp. OttesenSCG-928-O18]|nr:KpsF/GutQ family sugar-phosphate isomerase [Desulfovibrio sp. OttesenSCG-928-O18]